MRWLADGRTADNTFKTEEKPEKHSQNSDKTIMDNTIIALLALSAATLAWGIARHFLSKGGKDEWFPKELAEVVKKGRKTLGTDEKAKRIYDNAPEGAKMFYDLVLTNSLLLDGRTIDPELIRLFNETHTAVVDSMTDEGWDYILSNDGSKYFKTVVGRWREMAKQRRSAETKGGK